MSSVAEIKELFDGCRQAWDRGAKTVLALVTAVEGSAYRRPGAKMLLTSDGQMLGMISGGCLEGDLYGHAEQVSAESGPVQLHYDLNQDAAWGLGIGCQGRLDVLLLPLLEEDPFWRAFSQTTIDGGPMVWMQKIPDGARALLTADGTMFGDALSPEALALAEAVLMDRARPKVVDIASQKFFLDVISPSPHLIISGANLDAVAVAQLAATVGFEVSVLDPRPEFNQPTRIPMASHHLVMDPEDAAATLPQSSFWLIMNHHRHRDQKSIVTAMSTAARWIGILGPRRRTASLLATLGLDFNDGPFVSPVGLDLGAETAAEVALSIVAQLLSAERGRNGSPLHGHPHIHS